MKTDKLISKHLIESVIQQQTNKIAADPIESWEQMATKIISIIGEGGFDSIYARSLFLAKATFPWLESASYTPQTATPFLELKKSFAGQAPTQSQAANLLLLITFTGILTSLIGEQLTLTLLRSAWDLHTPVLHPQGFQK
jgi:hypothetical protein